MKKCTNNLAKILYFTDNGRVLCRNHLGVTAKLTGRDISGRSIASMPSLFAQGNGFKCETCGCTPY